NRTLVLIAKLSLDPRSDHRYVFENGAVNVDGRVRAGDFFARVQPALYGKIGAPVTIGRARMNKITLLPATDAASGMNPIPLTLDSPLLEALETTPGLTDYQAIQKSGGQLFRELLKNLDQLGRFFTSNFPRSLVYFAVNYAFVYAADKL